MAKDSRKIPSFTIKSAGITLSCASLILLAVSLVLGIIAVMEALSDGGFENLNQNLSSQNYGTLTEWISLIAPQLVFALTVFWFIKKYNIDAVPTIFVLDENSVNYRRCKYSSRFLLSLCRGTIKYGNFRNPGHKQYGRKS